MKRFYLKIGVSTAILLSAGLFGNTTAFAAEEITATTGNTPVNFEINSMNLPSNPTGTPTGGPTVPAGTNPGTIPEGSQFGLLFIPENFDFGKVDGFKQGMPITPNLKSNQTIGVGDTRKDSPGWQLTAKATMLENSKDNNILEGNISMDTAVKHVSFNGKNYLIDSIIPTYTQEQTPTTTGNVNLKLGGDATSIMDAAKGKGTGLWATDMSNVKLNPITNNLTQGQYSGKITWNLLNAPTV